MTIWNRPFGKRVLIFTAAMLCGGCVYCAAAAAAADSIDAAKASYRKGDYASAVKILAGALKNDPMNREALGLLNDSKRLLDQQHKQLRERILSQEAGRLNKQAQALYEKGELNEAVKLWSKVLEVNPGDDNATWMIQKAQTRLQIKNSASLGADIKDRTYSKKIKDIADDIARLIDQAKVKMEEEKAARRMEELATIQREVEDEEGDRLAEKERSSKKEELFISDTYNRGQRLYAEGKYEEALKEWESILPLLSQDDQLKRTVEYLKAELGHREGQPPFLVLETPAPRPVAPEPEKPKPAAPVSRRPGWSMADAPPPKPEVKRVTTAVIKPPQPAPQTPESAPVEIPAPAITPAPKPQPVMAAAEPVTPAPAPKPVVAPPPPPAVQRKVLTIAEEKDKVKTDWISLVIGGLIILLCLFLIGIGRGLFRKIIAPSSGEIGKDFDPSKLRVFVEKIRNASRGGKDIFKVDV